MERSLITVWLERLELFLYRRASMIVTVTNSFRDDLSRRGIDAAKIHVVVNGVDQRRYSPRPRDQDLASKYHLDGHFVVGYLGTHGMAHGLDKVEEAVEILRERKDIVFLFVGGGAERARLEQIVVRKGLENVRMVPRQPKEMMPRLWSLCDVSLIPLRDRPVFSTVIPSKLFESMGMGVPVIMSVPRGEATNIVEKTGCGVVVPPDDPKAIATAIAALAHDPVRMSRFRENCLRAVPNYNRDHQAGLMLDVLARTVSSYSKNNQKLSAL